MTNHTTPINTDELGSVPIFIRGKRVSQDGAGNVCLNDMWAAAGQPDNKRANDWHRGKRVAALEAALEQRITEILRRSPKEVAGTTYYTVGRGRAAKTFAHPVLALDYAEYLDPAIGIEVRTVFIRYKANDVNLALDIMSGLAEQADYDTQRVKLRDTVKAHNKMAAGMAQSVGVKNFVAYNGAGLRGLYNMTLAQLLQHKGLPADADRLDHAGHEELAANWFKATQAMAKIKRDKITGQKAAEDAHGNVAIAMRVAIASYGGVQMEDEPALEHIKEARKRVKLAEESKPPRALPSMPPE